jgi:hypothetical protein
MSHIVTIKTRITDPGALAAACRRLALAEPVSGSTQLYSSAAQGLIVHLPGWLFPVVVDTAKGEVHYDNFSGCWGSQSELDKLLQAYAVEKARIEARRVGHSVSEQTLADGSIKLTIQVAGGIAPAIGGAV